MIQTSSPHTFHIPVMGLCYTVDSPLKVARFGISSVASIIEDDMIEKMRKYHSEKEGILFQPITATEFDHRAKRVTAYLNLLDKIVAKQIAELKNQVFNEGSDIEKYFELLPDENEVKNDYRKMLTTKNMIEKIDRQNELRKKIVAGSIDVNIMSKVDRTNVNAQGEPLPAAFADAVAAFRGYANSTLNSSIVFSAGYNPRLYSFIEHYPDFFPDENGIIKKKIILKVSDYRSALIQGKILAKKGLWISEFRIESGLNCGGHAFATEGELLGPILEEFKTKKTELAAEIFKISVDVNAKAGKKFFNEIPELKITVQGGIGTFNENHFLLNHYNIHGTGWGSPFLLVPEAVNIDEATLNQLATAEPDDFYLSDASPLGIPFHNFRKSSSNQERRRRIESGRPGSPCYKKFLSSNSEFTEQPICTASREYQHLKIQELKKIEMTEEEFQKSFDEITAKECLCEGLDAAVFLKNNIEFSHGLKAVSVCPGPNLGYFSGVFSLRQMVDHIYGRVNILNKRYRPNLFVNELNLYVDYLKKEISKNILSLTEKKSKYLLSFKNNLLSGINYYLQLIPEIKNQSEQLVGNMKDELLAIEKSLQQLVIPCVK